MESNSSTTTESTLLSNYDIEYIHQQIGKELFSTNSYKNVRSINNYDIIIPATATMGALLLGNINAAADPMVLAEHKIRLICQCSDGHVGSITKERRKFALEIEKGDESSQTNNHNHSASSVPIPIEDSLAKVLELAFEDFEHIELLPYIEKAIPIIHYYRTRHHNIFINCAAGRSRSTSILLAYLMIHERMSFIDALRIIRNKRPIVCPNLGFVIQLMKLERSLYHYNNNNNNNTVQQPTTSTIQPLNDNNNILKSSETLPFLRVNALAYHPNFYFQYETVEQGVIEINEGLQDLYSKQQIESILKIMDNYNHNDNNITSNTDGIDPLTASSIKTAEELGEELFHLHVPLGSLQVSNENANTDDENSIANVVIPPNPERNEGGLLIASYLGASDPKILAKHKVRLIIQCAIEYKGRITSDILSKALQLEMKDILQQTDFTILSNNKHHHNPIVPCEVLELAFQDHDTIDLIQTISSALPIITKARKNNKTVLINCAAGISRSAATVLAHLLVYEKLSLIDALRKVRKARPVILPNIGFLVQLMRLERALLEYRQTKTKVSTDTVQSLLLPEDSLRGHMMYNFAFDNDSVAKEYLQENMHKPVPQELLEEMIRYCD